MKAVHILILLLLAVMASAAYVLLRPPARPVAVPPSEPPEAVEKPVRMPQAPVHAPAVTNPPAAPAQTPVQPIEERGDAMLFEIEALQNTPFDQAITMPFD